jgi:hypothetical protein
MLERLESQDSPGIKSDGAKTMGDPPKPLASILKYLKCSVCG